MADAVKFIWDHANTDHISRHQISPEEVEQVFADSELGIDNTSSEEKSGGP